MEPMMLLLMMAAPSSDLLATMERAEDAAYLAARSQLLEQATIADLEARRAESKYDAASWRSDVIADVAHFWMTRRADAEHAYALEGLDATKYRQRRRPIAEAGRELVRLNAAPIAFELLLKTIDRYPVQSEQERAALEDALVLALGASDHPAAPRALMSIARDDRWRGSVRRLAVSNLHGEAELIALLAERDPELRAGAVLGLASVRTLASVEALGGAAKDPALRLSAIRSLGSAASPRLLGREANRDAATIQSRASAALTGMLAEPDAAAYADALVETISLVRAPDAEAALAALAEREGVDRVLIARAQRRLARSAAAR